MTLFLNGGGSGEKTANVLGILKETIDTTKPLLYIPLAMRAEKYESCYQWIQGELAALNLPQIEMVREATEISQKNLADYGALFIGGGNTYKLLKELKETKNTQGVSVFNQIDDYVNAGGVVFGGSAGAILFGKTIDSCKHTDENTVDLKDTAGLDRTFEASIGAHYTNKNLEKTLAAKENYQAISKEHPVIALPEECTLVIAQDKVQVVGSKDYYVFQKGTCIRQKCGVVYTPKDFKKLIYNEKKNNFLKNKEQTR